MLILKLVVWLVLEGWFIFLFLFLFLLLFLVLLFLFGGCVLEGLGEVFVFVFVGVYCDS